MAGVDGAPRRALLQRKAVAGLGAWTLRGSKAFEDAAFCAVAGRARGKLCRAVVGRRMRDADEGGDGSGRPCVGPESWVYESWAYVIEGDGECFSVRFLRPSALSGADKREFYRPTTYNFFAGLD